jgi:hypothetical protein
MKTIWHMVMRLFVQRFYAQNSGFFLFLFVVLFGIVQTLTDSLIIAYHYQLIMGMLGNNLIFYLVLLLWLLYQLKCLQFVSTTLAAPENSFFQVINNLERTKVFWLLCMIQGILYLPVLIYSLAVIGISLVHHMYVKASIIIVFHISTCVILAKWYQQRITHLKEPVKNLLLYRMPSIPRPYFYLLLSYLITNLKFLFSGIKIFTCLLLMAFLKSLEQNDYDFRFMMLIYTMALIGNGVLIHKIRIFEETRLSFYRQLPITRFRRWSQYIVFYFILILPEFITLLHLMPLPLHYIDGARILLYTLSFLLLEHAILSAWWMDFPFFLKIATAIFFFHTFL